MTSDQPETTDAPDGPATDPTATVPGASAASGTSTRPAYAVFVGGYTAEMEGASPGISTFVATGSSREAVDFTTGAPVELESPSFLIKHPLEPWVYAVSETSPGKLSALRHGEDGSLELINTVETGGEGGCHLCFDADRRHVLVAHYTSGSVAAFAIGGDGALSDRTGLITFSGSGQDPERQDAPHAHQVVSVGEVILVPDLGTDRVHLIRVEPDGSLSQAGDPILLPAGAGPRHLVLAANHLVVACELSAQVWASPLDAAVGSAGHTVPSSGRQTDQRTYPSAIGVYRDQIIVANRGPDTLAFFSLTDGQLRQTGEIGCGGTWPRDLTLDGDRLWVANQSSDEVTVFARDADGIWSLDFRLPTPNPACVVIAR